VKNVSRTKVVIVVAFVLFIAYVIWNYRDEYEKTYVFREIPDAEVATYIPASMQPKAAIGKTLYKLTSREGDTYSHRYILWARQSSDEFSYQKAQLKTTVDGLTINVKSITATKQSEIKTDLVLLIESNIEIEPILVYTDNKRSQVNVIELK
jgi:hypothetical protein